MVIYNGTSSRVVVSDLHHSVNEKSERLGKNYYTRHYPSPVPDGIASITQGQTGTYDHTGNGYIAADDQASCLPLAAMSLQKSKSLYMMAEQKPSGP